ncbi:MAG: hypothetical protein FJ254_01680 [Phycisphaerae bacterium]|nr:hypothetical protein [Phycisphaerae bacterium]
MPRFLRDLGWGLFCASSWTWCIGTFLPFLMLRLHGWPGFWLFLVPNVLGCTLFGWWFTPQSSRAFCARHMKVLAAFSAVTAAYQVAFLIWMLPVMAGFVDEPGCATGAGTMTAMALGLATIAIVGTWWRKDAAWIAVASVATLGSIALLWLVPVTPMSDWPSEGTLPRRDLVLLAPIIIAGFFACPALDLTFHRARQSVESPRAFAFFGLSFGLTIIGVAMQWDGTTAAPGVAMLCVWCVQLPFTALAHLRELATILRHGSLDVRPERGPDLVLAGPRPGDSLLRALVIVGVVTAIGLVVQAVAPASPFAWYFPGETGYLRWLAMYGVVFPIVLLAARAGWRFGKGVVAVVLAGLGAELGILQDSAWWLLWPTGVMLIALIDAQRTTARIER